MTAAVARTNNVYVAIPHPHMCELWMADLGEPNGSVQSGRRPVLIISNDRMNASSPVVNVLPITSREKREMLVHIKLNEYERYGLSKPSTILAEQPLTIPVFYLDRKIGAIDDDDTLSRICRAMMIQIPILCKLQSQRKNNVDNARAIK